MIKNSALACLISALVFALFFISVSSAPLDDILAEYSNSTGVLTFEQFEEFYVDFLAGHEAHEGEEAEEVYFIDIFNFHAQPNTSM